MFRLLGPVVSMLVILAGLTGMAAAQAHEPPPDAMVLFEEAREQYRLGEYGAAAENLERALVLDPSAPTLLFNLARVYELMGEFDQSISVYRRLLAVTPAEQPEERARTQGTIDRLEGAREHRVPPPPPPEGDDERGPTFVRERGVADAPFWGLLVTGGVIALGAVGCGIGALVLHDQASVFVLNLDGTNEDREAVLASSRDLGLAADVVGGVGIATILAAGLLFILRERTYESWTVRLDAGITTTSVALSVGGVL